MEFVRMTVLVVDFSTTVAFGMVGMGLDSCAWRRGQGLVMAAARMMVKVQVLMQFQSFLRSCRCHPARCDSAGNRAAVDSNLSVYIDNEVPGSRVESADIRA